MLNNFLRFEFQLRRFWGLIFVLGIVFVWFVLDLKDKAATHDLVSDMLLYLGAAVIGFATSAFFSCPDQFLLRGVRDGIYLIDNGVSGTRVHLLADRDTMNAFSGEWHKVMHISERRMNYISRKADILKLSDAKLYRLKDKSENTIYAVLDGVRYGIPDQDTLEEIGGFGKESRVPVKEIDCFRPGRDLVSVQFWLVQDRKKKLVSSDLA